MNKIRRKSLEEVIAKISEARNLLEEIMDEEQEAFDNLPEGFQASERGEQMEEFIYTMEDKLSGLESAEEELQEIVDG